VPSKDVYRPQRFAETQKLVDVGDINQILRQTVSLGRRGNVRSLFMKFQEKF
jgi:hypothetical protein